MLTFGIPMGNTGRDGVEGKQGHSFYYVGTPLDENNSNEQVIYWDDTIFPMYGVTPILGDIVISSNGITGLITEIAQDTSITVVSLGAEYSLKGADGVGIRSINKVSTSGLVDTYRINLTDGTALTYTVTNGATGATGANGKTPVMSINANGELVATFN